MQLTEQHIIRDNRFVEWCERAKNLYNQCLYYCRQSVFGNIEPFSEYDLMKLMAEFNDADFRSLPSNTSQQIIKFLFKNMKAWRRARREYDKNPSKFLGKPKLPKYKQRLSELYFTYTQVRIRKGVLNFPKMMNVPPIKTRVNPDDFKLCRIIPKSNHFVVELVYNVKESPQVSKNDNIVGIDLGLNNLATVVSTNGNSFIISGKPLKSINHFYNKRIAKIKSSLKNSRSSKRIERLSFRRNKKINDYLHKASRLVVNKSLESNVSKIVIGNNEQWKQEINLGKKTNQHFSQIPHKQLIDKIEYKATLAGIEVVITEESYTSKCSSYDLEPVQKHETYVGKRTKRGLFRTAQNKYINADANGAANIIRKVSEDIVVKHIDSVRSVAATPFKVKSLDKSNVVLPNLLKREDGSLH